MENDDDGINDDQAGKPAHAVRGHSDVKDLVKRYVDSRVSRRSFLAGLAGAGLTATAAQGYAQDFAPFVTRDGEINAEDLPPWARIARGSGGYLLVEQLKAAGHQFVFANPSAGAGPVYDALVDVPEIQIIQAVHEGTLTAIADGYARASGKTPFLMIARPGVPNAMTQMFNSFKDCVPMVVATDSVSTDNQGQYFFEEVDHMEEMPSTVTKWHWRAESAQKIPELIRRTTKLSSTAPCGPTFLSFPEDVLRKVDDSVIMDQEKFTIAPKMPPDQDLIASAALMLVHASNPQVYAGDEVTRSGASKELIELAELLALPVMRDLSTTWSFPFPNQHPLYIGENVAPSRFPGSVDVMLCLGATMPYAWRGTLYVEPRTQLIQITADSGALARVYPAQLPILSDLKSGITALIAAVRQLGRTTTLKRVKEPRLARIHEYTAQVRALQRKIAEERRANSPISNERLALELEAALPPDAYIVAEIDSSMGAVNSLMSFSPDGKQYLSTAGFALGYGLPAALGVKLAQPNRPVVALISDGSFLFSGPQPLWSYARYKAPVLVVVVNNRSYNNERNRLWMARGRQFETGRDMICYLGDPDVDFVKLAQGFGVQGERVEDPEQLNSALDRGQRSTSQGLPYILDVQIERRGNGESSTWYPSFSIEASRQKKV